VTDPRPSDSGLTPPARRCGSSPSSVGRRGCALLGAWRRRPHGDEKTMALPVMNLVEHGSPLMPSGMFYPRAVAQL